MPNVIWPCVVPKYHADMSCRTSSNRVCFRRAMITCHARRRLIVYISKGDDGMPRSKSSDRVYIPRAMMALTQPTSCDRVYCPMAIMAWHARCYLIVFAIQGRWWHAMPVIVWSCFVIQGGWWHTTPDIVRSCVLSKGEDVIYARRRATVCAKLGEIYNWMG